jgi:hypothetical protein
MSELLKEAIEWITFDGVGKYGVIKPYFSGLTTVKDIDYEFECLFYDDGIDFADCGHDWGHCGDVNKKLAKLLAEDGDLADGYKLVLEVLKEAYKKWEKEKDAD